jgi:hypothetical protein
MVSRIGFKGRFLVASLTTVLFIMCFASACQPTPEKEVVVGKGNNNSNNQSVNSNTPSVANSQTPNGENSINEWVESFESNDKKFTINIDASIELPSNIDTTVDTVVPVEISAELIEKIINTFAKDKPLYNSERGTVTKEVIQEMLVNAKASKQSITDASSLAVIDQTIDALESMYDTAPTKDSLLSTPVTAGDLAGQKQSNSLIDFGDADIGVLNIVNDSLSSGIEAQFYKDANNGYTNMHKQSEQPRGVSISINDAQEVASEMLEKLGIDYMAFTDWYVANQYDLGSSGGYFGSSKFLNESKQCYVLYFTRENRGLSANYVQRHNGTESVEGDNTYIEHWTPEYISMQIDDSGVIAFELVNPVSIENQGTEKSELLSLDEIKEKFRFFMMDTSNDQSIILKSVNIEKVKLGWAFISRRDLRGQYELLPVWDFYGYNVIQYTGTNTEEKDEAPAYSLLTINAIDGSIIDRGLGY